MAEAEDVITDVARHATSYAHALWRRRAVAKDAGRRVGLQDVAARLDLLACAVFGRAFRLRPAQAQASRTFLDKVLRRAEAAPPTMSLPATDGADIWLPAHFEVLESRDQVVRRYRMLLLVQAMRAMRGSAQHMPADRDGAEGALYHILEAWAADNALLRLLPGVRDELAGLRAEALRQRPSLAGRHPAVGMVENMVRDALGGKHPLASLGLSALAKTRCHREPTSAAVAACARQLVPSLPEAVRQYRGRTLTRDWWLGEFNAPLREAAAPPWPRGAQDEDGARPVKSTRLARRPAVRRPGEDEDKDGSPGPAMVQSAQPHEQAEDPMGLQRPTDRDSATAPDDLADALSELPEARLVASPGTPREVLVSDDPPDPGQTRRHADATKMQAARYVYPEWDWTRNAYLEQGATVAVLPTCAGKHDTVQAILRKHAGILKDVRRQFELLRAQRTRLPRQLDGNEIDIEGWIDHRTTFLASGRAEHRLYRSEQRARRSMAVLLLVDISGSTDGWIADQCRVIDVEREALLFVSIALDTLDELFSVLAFSGEGPHGVVIRPVKRFDERYDEDVAERIAGMEPEKYTRAGAAIRHASAELMSQPAEHRLLIILSDGKPNDLDQYEGRYGVEDMRQAVAEAKLQGVSPFCLTIDRHASNYLPAVFGPHNYSLLQRAELLPGAIVLWLRKLLTC